MKGSILKVKHRQVRNSNPPGSVDDMPSKAFRQVASGGFGKAQKPETSSQSLSLMWDTSMFADLRGQHCGTGIY